VADAREDRARAAESRARVAESEESKAKAKLAGARAKPSRGPSRAKQVRQTVTGGTDPGFGSALTVLLAMGVLYVIVSGTWQRFGPAWTTLLHGGAGSAPAPAVKPSGITLPSPFPLPWQPSLS
jgi:hypothetical protein